MIQGVLELESWEGVGLILAPQSGSLQLWPGDQQEVGVEVEPD